MLPRLDQVATDLEDRFEHAVARILPLREIRLAQSCRVKCPGWMIARRFISASHCRRASRTAAPQVPAIPGQEAQRPALKQLGGDLAPDAEAHYGERKRRIRAAGPPCCRISFASGRRNAARALSRALRELVHGAHRPREKQKSPAHSSAGRRGSASVCGAQVSFESHAT